MNTWTEQQAAAIAAPQEIALATERADGTVRRPTTIWIVADGAKVFVRSTNGRSANWFRWVLGTGVGRITAGGRSHRVRFVEADPADLSAADAAYRTKYAAYASIVDHLQGTGPREATLQVHPY